MEANTNIAVKTIKPKDLASEWLDITSHLNDLTKAEKDVASAFLSMRIEMSDKISDDALLDDYILSSKIRKMIKTSFGIDNARFGNIISILKKKGFFYEDSMGNLRISKGYIPKYTKGSKTFKVVFVLKINE